MENLVANLSKKVSSGELFKAKYKTVPVDYEMNQLKSINSEEVEGWALRVISDGKIGFSSSTSENQFNSMVDKSIEIAQFGQEAHFDFPQKIDSSKQNKLKLFDNAVSEKSTAEMIETGNNIIERVKSLNADLRCDVGIVKQEEEIEYRNTYGASFHYQKSNFANSIMVQDTQENDMMMLMESQQWGQDNLSLDTLWEKIEKKIKWGKNIVEVDNGYLPVIFTPKALLVLILPLISGLNGKMINKKISPLLDKREQQLFSPLLSIYSDGTIDFAEGSAPFDDEGIKIQRLPLVEKGILKNYYYDLENAAEAGVKPTGNGIRGGFHSVPSPGINNLIIAEGDVSFSDMVGDLKRGIIVDQVLGLGQGNILSGAFSNNVQLGYKIENGKIIGRIKNVMIAGNALEVLKGIVAIGNEIEWKSGRYCFPHILVKSVSVATKS